MLNDKHRRGKEMIKYAKQIVLMLGILFVGFTGAWWLSQAAVEEYGRGESVRLVVSKTLPQLDGKQLELRAVEVIYEPGASPAPHSHPCPVIAYVTEGAIRSQVNDEPATIYKKGESFYEAPNDTHRISANASENEPAKLLAVFVCDHATPVTVARTSDRAGSKSK